MGTKISQSIMMTDKVAFVTGAAKGMGEGASRRFAEAGAAVVMADTDIKAAIKLAEELIAKGLKSHGSTMRCIGWSTS